jgi:hypothetical protein
MLLKQVWPHEGSAEKAVVFELDVEVVGLCVVVFALDVVGFGLVVVVFGVVVVGLDVVGFGVVVVELLEVVGKFTGTLVVPGDVQFPYEG